MSYSYKPGATVPESWTSLFNPNTESNLLLTEEDPSSGLSPATAIVQLLDDDHAVVEESWNNALVGFFMGKRRCWEAVNYSLTRAWKPKGELVIQRLGDFYVFQF